METDLHEWIAIRIIKEYQKELVAEYGFVMKQFSQVKEERGRMLSIAHSYQNAMVKSKTNERYGEGAAEFLAEAIEAF